MPAINWLKTSRYIARWLGLNLGVLLGAFGAAGFTFDSLAKQQFLIVLALTNIGWAYHVVSGYADSGTLPDNPPAAAHPPEPPPVLIKP